MASHEFALYCKDQFSLSTAPIGDRIPVSNSNLVHRIVNVLRLNTGDTIVLFDELEHIQGIIETINKKQVTVQVQQHQKNIQHQPTVTVQLGLIKRDALQQAVANLTCLGVQTIELFTSDRTQRTWDGEREFNRLRRCMVSAAEQSKNFAVPMLKTPVPLEKLLERQLPPCAYACGITGLPLAKLLNTCAQNSSIIVLVGPEGDFSEHEYDEINKTSYQWARLTSTVLRSEHAAFLAAGIIRTYSV